MPIIEIDGKPIDVAPGTTIMEAAQALGIYIPFFCYHPKLSVAANCRMCLVDVEKAPKPLPACATPVADGMKISTVSRKAKMAQQGVLEFLLINHPLDCPICDQGGECPLQDITMGFANPHSQYTEEKRVVEDQDIGPLIATEMTRCIQCTRCVRFGQEIGGIMELGATGRGERMAIGTYVAQAVRSELSGNMIDLCPVGALTSKPFRFKARNWELKHTPGICPHCSTGCHIDIQSRGREVMRVLPRPAEAVNEEWICDKGRFAYAGLAADDRVTQPLLRVDGEWREVSWAEALDTAVGGIEHLLREHGAQQLGGLISARASAEELFLFQGLLRGIGSPHVDHRLTQQDFRADAAMPLYPALNMALEDLEREPVILLCHGFPRHEQPLTNHRLRKAVLAGGQIFVLAERQRDFNYPVTQIVAEVGADIALYERLCRYLEQPEAVVELQGEAALARAAEVLRAADNPVILVGSGALRHPRAAELLYWIGQVAALAGGRLGWLGEGANSAGAWIAGCIPHRLPGGAASPQQGLPAGAMWAPGLKGYLLMDCEPTLDCWDGAAAECALGAAELVISIGCFSREAQRYAHVILPTVAFGEGAGRYINNEGREQPFRAAVRAPGEARPGWKILRVLGHGLGVEDFAFMELEEVTRAWQRAVGEFPLDVTPLAPFPHCESGAHSAAPLLRMGEWPLYRSDPLVRRSAPLAQQAVARLHPEQAAALQLHPGVVEITTATGKALLPLVLDRKIPMGAVWVPMGFPETRDLGPAMGPCAIASAPTVATAAPAAV